MARGRIVVLEKDEIERIEATSKRILSELGISVSNGKVSKALEDFGCSMSTDKRRILIPENVVDSAISTSSGRTVLLASRDGKNDICVPCGRTFLANGGEAVYVKNLVTGKRHQSTLDDVIDFTVLSHNLPQVDLLWTVSGATEQPPHMMELLEQRASFEYSTKHYQGGALNARQAREMIEVAALLAGGE